MGGSFPVGGGGSGAQTGGSGGSLPQGGSVNPTGGGGSTAAGGGGSTSVGGGGSTSVGGGGAGGAPAGGTGGTPAGGTGAGGDFPVDCSPPTGAHSADKLTRTCWKATASDCAADANNMDAPRKGVDADTTTRFSTGKKQLATNFTFEVDMGSVAMINGVSILSNATDFAPSLMVSVSTNGTDFTNVACGPGAMTTDFSFATVAARHVRFTQYGTIDKWWSAFDVNVYRADATDTCEGGGTLTDECTTPHTTGAE